MGTAYIMEGFTAPALIGRPIRWFGPDHLKGSKVRTFAWAKSLVLRVATVKKASAED